MTQDSETRLRELLSAVHPPASTMTATSLVREGRRTRRRRRQWLVTGAAGLATLGLASAAGVAGLVDRKAPAGPEEPRQVGTSATPAVIACAVQRLALPRGTTEGYVNAGSPNGRYLAGFAAVKDGLGRPVRWDGTRAEPIPVGGTGEAQGVNDSGVVVGEAQTAGRRSFAWAYAGGKVVELPIPDGYTGAEATAVNAAGQVSGVLFAGDRAAAVVWQAPTANADVDVLDAPGGAMAFGISDSGVVVGGLHDGSAAYRWDSRGKGSKLARPAGTAGGGAHGIRGEWAYGLLPKAGKPDLSAETGATDGLSIDWNVAVVWNLRTGAATQVDDGRVEAVSATGQAVVNHPDRTASIRAVDGTLLELPALPVKGAADAYAYALSDDGTRAGGSSAGDPVRWSCAPRW
jgi:probable HAF family extracellular repeat protein